MLGLVTVTMAVGYYKLGQANKGRRAARHEKRLARIALMPMLQVSSRHALALTVHLVVVPLSESRTWQFASQTLFVPSTWYGSIVLVSIHSLGCLMRLESTVEVPL